MNLDWLPASAVAATIVIIGWQVVYNNGKKLASRNETYSIANQISTLIADIQKISESFWLKGEFNDNPQFYELLVLSKIKLIHSKVKLLEKRSVEVYKVSRLIYPIRRSCTFDIHNIESQTLDFKREHIENILNSTLDFAQSLDEQMQNAFPFNN
ncbi:hypothetical protein [Shewanella sp.]|uniref:hypothetical protein n=1 Tax=Shewanella sp. TaxID=50422 RepID=UPI003569A36A